MRAAAVFMPTLYIENRCKFDYRTIVEPRPAGPTIGYFSEIPFTETVTDLFGRSFRFAGVIPNIPDARDDAELLRPGEFTIKPGLIYRLENFEEVAQSISPEEVPLSGWRTLGGRDAEIAKPHRNEDEFHFISMFWLGVALMLQFFLLAP